MTDRELVERVAEACDVLITTYDVEHSRAICEHALREFCKRHGWVIYTSEDCSKYSHLYTVAINTGHFEHDRIVVRSALPADIPRAICEAIVEAYQKLT